MAFQKNCTIFFQLLKETLINLLASKSWQIILKYLLATENLLKQRDILISNTGIQESLILVVSLHVPCWATMFKII